MVIFQWRIQVGARSQRNLFWPSGPHFGLKVTGVAPRASTLDLKRFFALCQ